jgi:hypothetical protein
VHCELVVPGLFGGEAAARLPSIELALARGRCTASGSQPLERWLAQAFGMEALPAGAATLLAAGDDPGVHHWVRADPVHLRLMRDRLILVPAEALHLRAEEAAALCEHLNRHFSGRLALRPVDAGRWVARLESESAFANEPPLSLAGRDVELAASGGTAAHQLLNESQMALHDHPVNEARAETPVNSLWFWGAGPMPLKVQTRFQSVSAAEPVALGLARAARIPGRRLPASASEWKETAEGRHLVVLDALRAPLALAEPGEYAEALAGLERDWFSPLLACAARRASRHADGTRARRSRMRRLRDRKGATCGASGSGPGLWSTTFEDHRAALPRGGSHGAGSRGRAPAPRAHLRRAQHPLGGRARLPAGCAARAGVAQGHGRRGASARRRHQAASAC